MIVGEALEKDERDQSFQMVNICVPPKVPHWLQVSSLMGTRPSFPRHLVSALVVMDSVAGKQSYPAAMCVFVCLSLIFLIVV